MFHEGQLVTVVGGDGSEGVTFGTHGKILALAGIAAGHVQWLSGPLAGRIHLVPNLDDVLAPASHKVTAAYAAQDGWEDSLEVGPVSKTGAAYLMATSGPVSVIQQLASTGAFADASDLGEEALAFVEARLRRSATLQPHLAELDEEDREAVLRLASRDLLAQACGVLDE